MIAVQYYIRRMVILKKKMEDRCVIFILITFFSAFLWQTLGKETI